LVIRTDKAVVGIWFKWTLGPQGSILGGGGIVRGTLIGGP
jgi:hypothetical protein